MKLLTKMLKRKWGNRDSDNSFGDEFFNNDAYSQHLGFCWNQGRSKSNFTMPWEVRMKTQHDVLHTFSQGMKFAGNIPPMPTSSLLREDLTAMVIAEDSMKRSGIPLAKASDAKLWEQKLSWERKCACKKWISLVAEQFTAWEICRQVATTDALSLSRGNLADSISDCLAAKATGTLHQRANPLLKYVMWWKERGLFPFPIQEAMVYEYIKTRTDDSPSGPKSLLTSISFAMHIFGLSGGETVAKSSRIKGLADSHFCKRRKVLQRPPLTSSQIIQLEEVVLSGRRTAYDRVAAGYFLLLIYGRLRYSDALFVSSLKIDGTYMEGKVEKTKTSITLERKVRHLPISITLESLKHPCWIHAWMEIREENGLQVGVGFPLLPNPVNGGGWSKTPLSVTAAGDWLRALLKVGNEQPEDGARIATHSCKTTLLSMAARFGIDRGSRRLLGYHTASKDKSLVIYSRDELALPLRKLDEMIVAIREQVFLPDVSRSGSFPLGNHVSAVPHDGDDASEASSDDSEGEEDNNFEEDEKAVETVTGEWGPKHVEGLVYVRNKTSRYIHIVADEGGASLKCGRMLSDKYMRLDKRPAFMHPACSTCCRL